MGKQALLVVDMQQGLFAGPRHDADGLLERLNESTAGSSPVCPLRPLG